MKTIGAIIAIATLLGLFFGAFRFMEGHYALAQELKNTKEYAQQVEKRLDQKIMGDQSDIKQNQIWKLEEKNIKKKSKNEWSEEDRDKHNRLQKELIDLEKKLDSIK